MAIAVLCELIDIPTYLKGGFYLVKCLHAANNIQAQVKLLVISLLGYMWHFGDSLHVWQAVNTVRHSEVFLSEI